jgi:hypothetical protein
LLEQNLDQPEYGTNTSYVVDFIEISFKVSSLNSGEIRFLFFEKGLSAAQIARKFGVSKSAIIRRLHQMRINVETGEGRMIRPDNYRLWNPPYGYRVVDGKLQIHKSEVKICRLVVQWV